MRIFRKPYDDHKARSCPSGSRYADKMQLVSCPEGGEALEKVGETDLQELINSYAESCDLHKILERCMQTGDYSILAKTQGVFADISTLAGDLRAMHDTMNHAKLFYETLTNAQKARFTSFEDFLVSSFDLNKFIEKLNPSVQSSTEKAGVNNESQQ